MYLTQPIPTSAPVLSRLWVIDELVLLLEQVHQVHLETLALQDHRDLVVIQEYSDLLELPVHVDQQDLRLLITVDRQGNMEPLEEQVTQERQVSPYCVALNIAYEMYSLRMCSDFTNNNSNEYQDHLPGCIRYYNLYSNEMLNVPHELCWLWIFQVLVAKLELLGLTDSRVHRAAESTKSSPTLTATLTAKDLSVCTKQRAKLSLGQPTVLPHNRLSCS